MSLPKWKELSPLIRRSKKRRYELLRTKINVLEEELESIQDSSQEQETSSQDST